MGRITRVLSNELYQKMNCPDLGSVIYFWVDNKKVYGIVESLEYSGFKGCNRGKNVRLKIRKFKNK